MRTSLIALVSLLVACGPSAAEQKAAAELAKARRECGRTYSSSEKVLQDMLYSRGVAEVEFAERNAYIEKCVELSLSSTELKCVDPNLAEGDECKAMPEASRKKVKELQKFMTAPMMKGEGDDKKKEEDDKKAEAGGEAAGEAGGEAAGGAEEAPAEAPAETPSE